MASKIKAIVCSILIVLMFVGGGYAIYYFSKPSKNSKVIATIFPIYDITREIMGNADDIMLLEDNGVDIHNFSPTTSDMTAIAKSELFLYVGGESDKWVSDVLKTTNSPNLITVKLLDEIESMEESKEGILDSEHSHEHNEHESNTHESHSEHAEKELDEHIWLSPKNVIVMTEKIRDSLSLIFPERKEIFRINSEKYISKIQNLNTEYSSICSNSDKTLIVADRFPFGYLNRDYGIKYYACFSGCSTETQASADMISKLIQKISEEDAKYICVLETSDRVIANSVLNDKECKKGVQVEVLDSCQSVSYKQKDKVSLYDVLLGNLEVLKKVLERWH